MYRWWNSLQPIARTLIVIALIVLVFMIIYYIRMAIKKGKQQAAFNNDYDQLVQQQGQKPSFLQSEYLSFADRIYEAGCSGPFCYGTDEEAIKDVFNKMNNELDVLLLVKAFGLREPRGTICIPVPGTGECDYPLGQWLQTELSTEEFKEVNTILSKKGIKYQF